MTSRELPSAEVVFHPLSFGDANGRLFSWNGQLYRGVADHRVELYQDLFAKGVVQDLIEKRLLVPTELTPYVMGPYSLILQHKKIPFVSYAYEWCPLMLKDAALLLLDLEIELATKGFTLQDAHPWNLLFDGPNPIFVDFGSIVPTKDEMGWPAHDEFCRFFLYPLHLMTHGHARMAFWLLHDYDLGVLRTDVDALWRQASLRHEVGHRLRYLLLRTKERLPASVRHLLGKLHRGATQIIPNHCSSNRLSHLEFVKRVRREVEALNVSAEKTEWSGYYEGCFPSFSPSEGWTAKHRSMHHVLTTIRPATLLDIGSNRGWFSQLGAHLGIRVVATDADSSCATELYCDVKRNDLPVLPLVMDFTNPSPGYGLCNESLAPATQRLRCEMVTALALVHHLVFKRQLTFDQIVMALAVFSEKWLAVEFIPREDRYVRAWWTERYAWYNLQEFLQCLKRYFRSVATYPSNPEPRVILVCEK